MKGSLVLVIALALTHRAAGQRACSFDTSAHTRMDSVDIGLAAGWYRTARKKLPDDYMAAAMAIQARFQAPEHVRLPLWARVGMRADTLPDESELIGHGLDTEIQFFLSDSGRVVTERIEMAGASPDIVISVVSAILRADSAHEFSPPSDDVRRDKGAIQLRLVDAPHTTAPAVPLLRVKIPVLVIDSGPSFLWMPPVEYPVTAQRVRMGERVMVQMVVEANGRPDTTTIRVLQASYKEFAVEARKQAREAHFRPAKVGGCPVPVVVLMPIDFTVPR